MFRLLRRLFRPIGRFATLILLWEHRKSVTMAVRSVRHEFDVQRRAGLDVGRWKALGQGIWQSRRSAEQGSVKSVIVDDAQRTVPLTTTPGSSSSGMGGMGSETGSGASDSQFQYSSVS